MEEVVKRKRGRPRKDESTKRNPNPAGSPLLGDRALLIKDDEKRVVISRIMVETIRTYKMPKVKSNQELAQRISDYFQTCAESGEKPTVEQLAQCTGYTISTVWDWENGRKHGFKDKLDDGSTTAAIIKRAKDFLRVFDAKLVVGGYMNPVAYIFRAKNYYGMRDQTEIVVPTSPAAEEPDADKLLEEYAGRLPDPLPVDFVEKD